MKLIKTFSVVIVILSAIHCLGNESNNEYFPIGKTFVFEQITHNQDAQYICHTVVKDTIIDDDTYQKIQCEYLDKDYDQEKWSYLVHEKNGMVFHLFSDDNYSSLIPYLDYSLGEGEIAPYFNSATGSFENYGMYVGKVEYLTIKNHQRKIMTMEFPKGHFSDYWIEGIGAVHSHYMCGQPLHGTQTLIGCYHDEECLFDIADLSLFNEVSENMIRKNISILDDKISYNAGADRIKLKLYNLSGISTSETEGSEILELPTDLLPKGIYVLEISSKKSTPYRTKIML